MTVFIFTNNKKGQYKLYNKDADISFHPGHIMEENNHNCFVHIYMDMDTI